MTEVYNSYKNNSCKNLKRTRDEVEDEVATTYINRYKKIRDYLDEHGLHEVNEDNLVNFFTKKVTLSIDEEMKDAQKQEDIEDECRDDEDECSDDRDEDEDNSEVLEETEEESEWDGFSESEEDSDDEEDEEESEWDEFSESEYKEDEDDELSEDESIAIKEIEGSIY